MEFPAPSIWEFGYMFSLVPVAYSSGAMPYNNNTLMVRERYFYVTTITLQTRSYYYTFFLSIIPLVVGAGQCFLDAFSAI